MGFLQRLFAQPKPKSLNETINEAFTPLAHAVAAFKDKTGVSWLNIIPAVEHVAVRLLIQCMGIDAVKRKYANIIQATDEDGGAPVMAHLEFSKPDIRPELEASLNSMLWSVVRGLTERGVRVEVVALAFGAFAKSAAEDVVGGDQMLVKALMAETMRNFNSGFYNADRS